MPSNITAASASQGLNAEAEMSNPFLRRRATLSNEAIKPKPHFLSSQQSRPSDIQVQDGD